MSGARSNAWGRAAEDEVARWYAARGGEVLARRRRRREGELDLVVRLGDALVFVEVKARRSLDAARAAVTPAQARRLFAAAARFAADDAYAGLDLRFDFAALDRSGGLEIVENAMLAHDAAAEGAW